MLTMAQVIEQLPHYKDLSILELADAVDEATKRGEVYLAAALLAVVAAHLKKTHAPIDVVLRTLMLAREVADATSEQLMALEGGIGLRKPLERALATGEGE